MQFSHPLMQNNFTRADMNAAIRLFKEKNIVLTQSKYVKKFEKDDLLSELGLEHLIKTSPVRIKCALLSLKSLKYGIYSYFADKMNDAESAGNLNEEAANLY